MSQNDQVTESAIQAKGLNAPRVTPDRINELMGRIAKVSGASDD